MRTFLFISTAIFILYFPGWAEKHLGGEITEDMILYSSDNPYIIDENLIVPNSVKLSIKSGTVFLFKSSTSMKIYGTLIVEGSIENQVIFTSINDDIHSTISKQEPSTVDWDGIYISENAQEISMKCFKLMYSVYGIKSFKKEMKINEAFFAYNGKYNIIIKGEVQYDAKDKFSYDYLYPEKQKNNEPLVLSSTKAEPSAEEETSTEINSVKSEEPSTEKLENITLKEDIQRKITIKKISSIGIFSTSIICGIGGAYFYNNFTEKEDKYEYYAKNRKSIGYYPELEKKTLDKGNKSAAYAWILGSLCVAGLSSSSFLYFRQYKKEKELNFNVSTHYNFFKKSGNLSFSFDY